MKSGGGRGGCRGERSSPRPSETRRKNCPHSQIISPENTSPSAALRFAAAQGGGDGADGGVRIQGGKLGAGGLEGLDHVGGGSACAGEGGEHFFRVDHARGHGQGAAQIPLLVVGQAGNAVVQVQRNEAVGVLRGVEQVVRVGVRAAEPVEGIEHEACLAARCVRHGEHARQRVDEGVRMEMLQFVRP